MKDTRVYTSTDSRLLRCNKGVLIYKGKYKERDCYTFYVFFNGNKEKRMLIGVSYKQAYTEDLLKFVVYNWLLKGNVVFVE